MKNVALVGEFASGKTTLAKALADNHGFRHVSFARRLKQMAAAVYNGGKPIEKDALYLVTSLQGTPRMISGRMLLQQLGQSVKTMDRDLWVKWLIADIANGEYGPGPFVTDDCRFPYEADELRLHDFLVIRIMTPERVRMERYELTYGRWPTQEELNHPSETEVRNIVADFAVGGTENPDAVASYIVEAAAR